MPTLPALRPDKNVCESPHLVLVGAGASRASCPNGDEAGHVLPLMGDLVEVTGVDALLDAAGIEWKSEANFEAVYASLASSASHADTLRKVQDEIRSYFDAIRIPRTVTLYDRLLLSLRPKDYIATFNWDPLLAHAYIRNRRLGELPQVLFLHGNVAVGACTEHRSKGFLDNRCGTCRQPLLPTRLLYPIGQKNYTADPFISQEWDEFRAVLEHAYLLTIIGYAAPASDVEAVTAMRMAWDSNQMRGLVEIDIVDVRPRAELEATWLPFFDRDHYAILDRPIGLFNHARRSCDHFAMATLQQRPCRDSILPDTSDLAELQIWAETLIREEVALRDNGSPLPC